jgi:hypothetical protein
VSSVAEKADVEPEVTDVKLLHAAANAEPLALRWTQQPRAMVIAGQRFDEGTDGCARNRRLVTTPKFPPPPRSGRSARLIAQAACRSNTAI